MKKSKLVIGISSRALFDLDESHKIFERDGVDAYREYQILNEEKILNPGNAFGLVKKILEINNLYKSKERVEVILLSRNSADTGLRVFNSIEAHSLDISRAVFCGGESPLLLKSNRSQIRKVTLGMVYAFQYFHLQELVILQRLNPVSYTHLTLPTTPYV